MQREDVAARGRGRPRDMGKDEAIREAAWELLAEQGYAGFSFEALAARAGCGRATLYRRFPSKQALVATILNESARSLDPGVDEDGDPRAMLFAHAKSAALFMSGARGKAILRMSLAADSHPALGAALNAHGAQESRFFLQPLARLAPDAGPERLLFAFQSMIGAIIQHVVFRRDPPAPEEIGELVEMAIRLASGRLAQKLHQDE